jgi:hypothetical protein
VSRVKTRLSVLTYTEEYLQTDYDIARCCYKLFESGLFDAHKEYVRQQIVYCLLQEDSPQELYIITAFLLYDGRHHESTFETMNEEGVFPRLLELIQYMKEHIVLHRMLLELLYEMSRIQRIKSRDLVLVEDEFISYLLGLIEDLSADVNDPYHYPVIRVLVGLCLGCKMYRV